MVVPKHLTKDTKGEKLLENPSANQVGPFFTDLFKKNKSNSLKLIFTLI